MAWRSSFVSCSKLLSSASLPLSTAHEVTKGIETPETGLQISIFFAVTPLPRSHLPLLCLSPPPDTHARLTNPQEAEVNGWQAGGFAFSRRNNFDLVCDEKFQREVCTPSCDCRRGRCTVLFSFSPPSCGSSAWPPSLSPFLLSALVSL